CHEAPIPAEVWRIFNSIQAVAKIHPGASEVETARFRPELSISNQPWVRSWERIARMRALGSQPSPPAPGWRGGPDKPYPGIRLAIVRQSADAENPPNFCARPPCLRENTHPG